MSKGLEYTFLQKRYIQIARKHMKTIITNCHKNANQNHMRYHLTLIKMTAMKKKEEEEEKKRKRSVGKDME